MPSTTATPARSGSRAAVRRGGISCAPNLPDFVNLPGKYCGTTSPLPAISGRPRRAHTMSASHATPSVARLRSLAEATDALRCSRQTIYRMVRDGDLHFVKVRAKTLVAGIDQLIARQLGDPRKGGPA